MIFTVSSKSLTLLSLGVASVTGANLRQRRATAPVPVQKLSAAAPQQKLRGAVAVSPLELYAEHAVDTHSQVEETFKLAPFTEDEKEDEIVEHVHAHPLTKFQKGTKMVTERQHATISESPAEVVNAKILSSNNVEVSITSDEEEIHTAAAAPTGNISSDKDEYEEDDSVTVDFSLPGPGRDLSGHKIGIFMRGAHPHAGELEPVVSMPLCPESGCTLENDLATGSITFSAETIDLYQWGTGFDAYILDESGEGIGEPVKFNIKMADCC